MTAELQNPQQTIVAARLLLAEREAEFGDLNPESLDAAEQLALAYVAAGRESEGVKLMRGLAQSATKRLGGESEITGIARSKLATVLGRARAPEAEQLSCLTEAIEALSTSVGPSHPHTTAAFTRLAVVALDAHAIEVAVTAAMQALGGLRTRGEDETPVAGGIYATLAMASATRRSPAAPGAAERAHRLTQASDPATPDRKRAQMAFRALGSPRRHPITDELSVIAFGTPAALVIELDHVAPDGAIDQHNHGLRTEAARSLRSSIAAAPFSWQASAGGFEMASRTGGAAVLRFKPTAEQEDLTGVEVVLDASALDRLRRALADELSGTTAAAEPGRNDPCPCGSGRKYKRCCGRD
ncbi:MAG TPA: SEC-C metal-binding domain-containing protein [Solirubrobacteraceae bacterium]|jgi:hypothetical protein